jgi:hypothetical protein
MRSTTGTPARSVGLFRRSKPLHRQLAEAGGLIVAPVVTAASPPAWDGEQRGEPGIHGVPRARRWDAVAPATAPDLRGDVVHFAALPDGTLLVDEDEPAAALTPLADAVEATLRPPYRAEAARRDGDVWAVGARRIAVVSAPGLEGDEAELAVTGDERTLTIDGRARVARARALEELGEREGRSYVVRASRLDGDLWEAEATPL